MCISGIGLAGSALRSWVPVLCPHRHRARATDAGGSCSGCIPTPTPSNTLISRTSFPGHLRLLWPSSAPGTRAPEAEERQRGTHRAGKAGGSGRYCLRGSAGPRLARLPQPKHDYSTPPLNQPPSTAATRLTALLYSTLKIARRAPPHEPRGKGREQRYRPIAAGAGALAPPPAPREAPPLGHSVFRRAAGPPLPPRRLPYMATRCQSGAARLRVQGGRAGPGRAC